MSKVYTDQAITDAIVAATTTVVGGIAVDTQKFIETFNSHRDRALCTSLGPQWQPIHTAPKDGTEVLGLCDWQPLTVVMFFRDGEWLVKWDEAKLSDGYEATHWMPLPAPKVEA